MKTTYLIKSIQSDGSAALVETTAEHWHEITENNKLLPKDERRYFITDIISESGKLDCMVMEVPYKEFLHWLADQSPANRNNSLKEKYSHLSLDESVMNDTIDQALEAWRPWAVDFLNFYLKGKKASSTAFVADKYNVSQRMARNYKKQFEGFVKKFCF